MCTARLAPGLVDPVTVVAAWLRDSICDAPFRAAILVLAASLCRGTILALPPEACEVAFILPDACLWDWFCLTCSVACVLERPVAATRLPRVPAWARGLRCDAIEGTGGFCIRFCFNLVASASVPPRGDCF